MWAANDAATAAELTTALNGIDGVTAAVTVAGAGLFDVTYADSVVNVDLLLLPAELPPIAPRLAIGRAREIAAALSTCSAAAIRSRSKGLERKATTGPSPSISTMKPNR